MEFRFLQPIGNTLQLTPIPRRGQSNGLAAANQLLAPSLRIRALSQLPQPHPASSAPLQLSWWAHGEVSISRLQGPTLELEPLQPLCTLLLPGDGQPGGHAAEALTYLPARRWQHTHHGGLGLGLHCSEEALRSRLLALSHRPAALTVLSQLGQAQVFSLAQPHRAEAYRQLLLVLQLLEQSLITSGRLPHPFLRLDDLILRAIALLLCPEPNQVPQPDTTSQDPRGLQQSVNDLMGWLLANLHQPITLADIERRSAYSRRTIQLGFKQQVGCGPMQWLRRQRLEAAYRLLQGSSGELTVSAVARRCGYLSLSSFSRDFTEVFKRTPSSLLRQNRTPAQASARPK